MSELLNQYDIACESCEESFIVLVNQESIQTPTFCVMCGALLEESE